MDGSTYRKLVNCLYYYFFNCTFMHLISLIPHSQSWPSNGVAGCVTKYLDPWNVRTPPPRSQYGPPLKYLDRVRSACCSRVVNFTENGRVRFVCSWDDTLLSASRWTAFSISKPCATNNPELFVAHICCTSANAILPSGVIPPRQSILLHHPH